MSVQTHYPSRLNLMTACGVGDSPVPLLGNLISDCHNNVSQELLTLPVGRSPPSWYERNHTDWCECAKMSSYGHCTHQGKCLRRTCWSYARWCATLVWLHRADWNRHINLTQLLVIIGDTHCCCNKSNHWDGHLARHYPIASLMDREPATEPIGKWVRPTSEIEVANDIDQMNVSIWVSLEWEEIELVALREVS